MQHPKVATLGPDLAALHNIQTKHPWRQHQSVVHGKQGKCVWEGCPHLTLGEVKRKRGYNIVMRCEEYSIEKGKNVIFGNDVKGFVEGKKGERKTCRCHLAHHTKYHRNDGQSSK